MADKYEDMVTLVASGMRDAAKRALEDERENLRVLNRLQRQSVERISELERDVSMYEKQANSDD